LSQEQLTIEPKKFFQLSLMRELNKIREMLYHENDGLRAVNAILGVIDSLPQSYKDELKDLKIESLQLSKNPKSCQLNKVRALYSDLTTFLHKTLLSEVSGGIIPASMLKGDKKKPKAQAYPKVLSSEVP